MEEFSYEIKIPQERVAILIGKEGRVKEQLEEQTNTLIEVDSQEGDVFLKGTDSIGLYLLKDVIKAIGRGFNPEIAMQLLKQDYVLELLSLKDVANTHNQMQRVKGRVIGKAGKARATLEELTKTNISVYGKTIAIIGFCDDAAIAKRAVESLLTGSTHASVYKWLEKQRRDQKMAELSAHF